MRYKVNDDFSLEIDKADDAEKLHVKAGTVFIPAEINYPLDKVEELVKAGTIELIAPVSSKASAKRK